MKKYFISLLLIATLSNVCLAQIPTIYKGNPDSLVRIMSNEIYNGTPLFSPQFQFQWYNDTVPVGKPQVLYGIAGIKQQDSSKIYYKKYIQLKNKGVPDSLNKYKILLDRYKQ